MFMHIKKVAYNVKTAGYVVMQSYVLMYLGCSVSEIKVNVLTLTVDAER